MGDDAEGVAQDQVQPCDYGVTVGGGERRRLRRRLSVVPLSSVGGGGGGEGRGDERWSVAELWSIKDAKGMMESFAPKELFTVRL